MTPLRIAQVCADAAIAPGDSEEAALHLSGVARGLTEIGHEVVTFARRSPVGDHSVSAFPLSELARHGYFDVIYERYSLDHLGGLEVARTMSTSFVLELNAPLVAAATGTRPETVRVHSAAREELLVSSAEIVLAASKPLRTWATARRDADHPTMVVGNGFDPSAHANGAPIAQRASRTIALFGQPNLRSVRSQLLPILTDLADLPQRAELLVIGGAEEAETVRALARSAGLSLLIGSTGPLDPTQTLARLRTAAIAIALYPIEDPFYPSPLEITDSLAAGVPVITTDQGDLRDLVGGRGFAVAADDPAAICRTVRQLLDDPDLRARLSRQGRLSTWSSATWSHVAEQIEAAIGIGKRSRPGFSDERRPTNENQAIVRNADCDRGVNHRHCSVR